MHPFPFSTLILRVLIYNNTFSFFVKRGFSSKLFYNFIRATAFWPTFLFRDILGTSFFTDICEVITGRLKVTVKNPTLKIVAYYPSFNNAKLFSVVLYFCLLLCGLSGIVISNNRSCNKGLIYLFLNFVRFTHLNCLWISDIAFSLEQKESKRSTSSRLSPDLGQLGPRLGPFSLLADV